MARDLPLVQPRSRRAWRAWLQKHHDSCSGIWLVYAKKHTGIPSLTYADAVEEALCFGWIDSLLHPIDAARYKQMFTPRKDTSVWSALNRTRVERLIADGSMTPAGLRLVEIAKNTGRWTASAATDALTMPAELKQALKRHAAAKQNWPTYTPSQQKAFLRMVEGAKTAETRARRVAQVMDIVGRRVSFSDLVKRKAARAPGRGRARRRR